MPRATYRDLGFELPEGWEDGSVITLLAPAAVADGPDRPNVVLVRKWVGRAPVDLAAFAAGQEQLIRSMAAGVRQRTLEVEAVGESSTGLRAFLQELHFEGPNGRVGQLHAYFGCRGWLFMLTATGPEGDGLDAAAAQLRRMLRTFTLSPSPG